jgi:hypothetical protein
MYHFPPSNGAIIERLNSPRPARRRYTATIHACKHALQLTAVGPRPFGLLAQIA